MGGFACSVWIWYVFLKALIDWLIDWSIDWGEWWIKYQNITKFVVKQFLSVNNNYRAGNWI